MCFLLSRIIFLGNCGRALITRFGHLGQALFPKEKGVGTHKGGGGLIDCQTLRWYGIRRRKCEILPLFKKQIRNQLPHVEKNLERFLKYFSDKNWELLNVGESGLFLRFPHQKGRRKVTTTIFPKDYPPPPLFLAREKALPFPHIWEMEEEEEEGLVFGGKWWL